MRDLPETAVPAERYDRDYYLKSCAGADEWRTSKGRTVSGLYPGTLEIARFRPGEYVVDIGTGRGELPAVAAELGARKAVGVDYSPDAIELARETLRVHGVEDRASVLLADARAIPVEDDTADLVTMLDVVEHLSPSELQATLGEAFRILRPGGRLLVHTMPNRNIYAVTYRLQRSMSPRRLRTWPADPRHEFEHAMHVNEQTVSSLRRALRRAGFRPARAKPGKMIYTDFVPSDRAARLYHRMAKVPGLARLAVTDLWGHGRKPAHPSGAR
jgi:ubiquinone/menaquinone biosynthesis C-methylase UbiE